MSLILALKKIFSPRYEIEADLFYKGFLKDEDAQNLMPFLKDFGNELPIPSAILAVGSSTYPRSFWENRRQINREDSCAEALESYADIDLLVVPEGRVFLNIDTLEDRVQDTLILLGFKSEAHETTTTGVSYHKQLNGTYSPFLHIGYGLHSVSTNLKNGTKVDLILGREDLLNKTASQKIAEERKGNYPFSLLYRRSEFED